jgi:hypothetical protein
VSTLVPLCRSGNRSFYFPVCVALPRLGKMAGDRCCQLPETHNRREYPPQNTGTASATLVDNSSELPPHYPAELPHPTTLRQGSDWGRRSMEERAGSGGQIGADTHLESAWCIRTGYCGSGKTSVPRATTYDSPLRVGVFPPLQPFPDKSTTRMPTKARLRP